MEVLVGATFGIDRAYVRGSRGVAVGLLMTEESGGGGTQIGVDESSESSSSIGAPGENSDNGEEEDDAVSSRGGLDSFTSLEDSLPIKRGLSNHYTGKSKSFGNLMEASDEKDLVKVENPFNKKRRLVVADKLRRRSRRSSSSQFYAWKNPSSVPLLAVQETDDSE